MKRTTKRQVSADKPARSQRDSIAAIADDDDVAPNVRLAAHRTLAELDGQLGKHAPPPAAVLAAVPLSGLTRGELEQELARLRQHIAAQAVTSKPARSTG